MVPPKKRQKVESEDSQTDSRGPAAPFEDSKPMEDLEEILHVNNASKLTFANLPSDILYETAAHLPPHSLLCLSQTCASVRSAFHPDRANRLFYDALPAPVYFERSQFEREDLESGTEDGTPRLDVQHASSRLGGPYNRLVDYKTEVRYRIHCQKLCCMCLDFNSSTLKAVGQPFGDLAWCMSCYDHFAIGDSLATLMLNKKIRSREIRLSQMSDSSPEKIRQQIRWRIINEAERIWESDGAALVCRKEVWQMFRQAAPALRIKDHLFAPEALHDDPMEYIVEPFRRKWLQDPVKDKLSWHELTFTKVSDEWVTSTALEMIYKLLTPCLPYNWRRTRVERSRISSVTTWSEARKQWQLARMKSSLDSGAVVNMDAGAHLHWDRVKGIREDLGLPRECHGDHGRVGRKDKSLLEAFSKIITSTCPFGHACCGWTRKPFERKSHEGLIDHYAKRHKEIFWTREIAFTDW
ncbi:MAG: hypothetical protein M1831_006415 [Alyxoria varia]|nr:MAG: hypothetical protein M1831_006415 [Alyxoria varia]